MILVLYPVSNSHLPVDTILGTIRRWHWRDIARGFASPGSRAFPSCSYGVTVSMWLSCQQKASLPARCEPVAHIHLSFAGASEAAFQVSTAPLQGTSSSCPDALPATSNRGPWANFSIKWATHILFCELWISALRGGKGLLQACPHLGYTQSISRLPTSASPVFFRDVLDLLGG